MLGSYRWVTALTVDVVLFVLVWWLAESPVALDRGTALALAGFAAALVALPLGSWATRPAPAGPPPGAPGHAGLAGQQGQAETAGWAGQQGQGQQAHVAPGPVAPGLLGQAAQVVAGAIPRGAAALVERTELLDEVGRAHASSRIAVVSVLTGTRGVGKTQLAAAYARRRVEDGWPVVAWIPAEAEDQIVSGLAELTDLQGLRRPETDSATAARDTLRWLQHQPGPGLLVYDNVGDPDLVGGWLPSVGNVHLVLTTTRQAVADLGRAVHVDLFTEAEAVAYLAERTGLHDDDGARKLAAAVGYLPLALAQAAAVVGVRRPHPGYQDYLDRLTQVHVGEHLRRVLGDPYSLTAAQALRMSIDEISEADGRHLLELLAVFSAAGVPRWLLRHQGPSTDAAVALLADRSLVSLGTVGGADQRGTVGGADQRGTVGGADQRGTVGGADGDVVSEHRLMRRVVWETLISEGRLDPVVASAAAILDGALVPADRAWDQRQVGDDLVAQIDALAESAAAAPEGALSPPTELTLLRLRRWAVRHLHHAYDPIRAVAVGRSLVADGERALGGDHPETLAAMHSLASAALAAGGRDEAVALYERAVAGRGRVLGADDPDTLKSRNRLAGAYLTMGRRSEAIELYERTMADRERALGADHPDTLTSRSNLAFAYRSAGRAPEAIALYERTIADRTRVLGPDHPDTLLSRGGLAYAQLVAGHPDLSVTMHESVVADRERVLGPDHPDTLTSRSGLALAYLSAKRYDDALGLLAAVVAERERLLGEDSMSTLTDRRNLAAAFRSAGRHAEAIPVYERSAADHERVLGPDHPATLTAERDLGYALRAAGRLDEAVEILQQNLADRVRVMGADHHDTVSLRNSLKGTRRRAQRRSADGA